MTAYNKVMRIWDTCNDKTWLRGNGRRNGEWGCSPGRNDTLWSDAGVKHWPDQANCTWRHFNAYCHFFYVMDSLFLVFLSISSDETICLCFLRSFSPFLCIFSSHSPSHLPMHHWQINISHFYLTIFSLCLQTASVPSPWFFTAIFCPILPHHFLTLSISLEQSYSDVHLSPHLSFTCGNLCSTHCPTAAALLMENVSHISLLSMHSFYLWRVLCFTITTALIHREGCVPWIKEFARRSQRESCFVPNRCVFSLLGIVVTEE